MNTLPVTVTTTLERIDFLKRAIAEHRAHAVDFRARAIGANDGRGAHHLNDAIRCELIAEGYERALAVLFP